VTSVNAARIQVPAADNRDPATERAYDALAERLIPVAADLVERVREEGRESIGELLDSLSALERHALPVVLAAMVPHDQRVADLLAWVPRPNPPRPSAARAGSQAVRPCGTHAAFVRHKSHGEPACALCAEAERVYQRNRKLRARKQRSEVTAGRQRARS
jgi:hypothetical protein